MSDSRKDTFTKNAESKIDSPIPFSVLPEPIQNYVLQKISKKDWAAYNREQQQKILDECDAFKTANQAQAIEQKPVANNNNIKVISKDNLPLLKKTPNVVWGMIGEFLGSNSKVNSVKTDPTLKEINALAEVSKASYFLFQPVMAKAKKAKLKELFEAILCPEVDKTKNIDKIADIKKMLEEYPFLLLEELDEKECMTIRGPSGHPASKTAYRTALATEDTQLAEMIKAKLIEVAGQKAADDQYDAQFPKGWEALEEKRWAPLFNQLEVLTQAIKNATEVDIVSSRTKPAPRYQGNTGEYVGHTEYKLTVKAKSTVEKTLLEFRSRLDKTLNDAATTGRHFNPNFLLKVFQIWGDHDEEYFENVWDDPRALAFWQLVIGYSERFMPVNYVQAFLNGVSDSEEELRKGLPQNRSLKSEVPGVGPYGRVPFNFYPLSLSGPGFKFAVWHGGWFTNPRPLCTCGDMLSKFMSIKNSKLTELTYAPPKP